MSDVALINAPSNLGLRPLRPGHVPGAWRAPQALIAAGLLRAVRPSSVTELARPRYDPGAQPGTTIRNGHDVRSFSLALADAVVVAVGEGRFPLVIGGDCSILLGALAGIRRFGPIALVHIDGHSDFRHPGNYDTTEVLGSAAGMDLALATGRGEQILTDWPGVTGPLVPDGSVVQIGERESGDEDFAWPDIYQTEINCLDTFQMAEMTAAAVVKFAFGTVDRQPGWPFWVHLDLDVLDESVMPAVDCPGSPGIDPQTLTTLLGAMLADARCAGMTVTDFDPELDPEGRHARYIVGLISAAFEAAGPIAPTPKTVRTDAARPRVRRGATATASVKRTLHA